MTISVWEDIFAGEPEKIKEGELRTQLMDRVQKIIQEHSYTNKELSKVLKVNKSEVTLLMQRNLGKFSSDRLMIFLDRLGQTKFKINFGRMPKKAVSDYA